MNGAQGASNDVDLGKVSEAHTQAGSIRGAGAIFWWDSQFKEIRFDTVPAFRAARRMTAEELEKARRTVPRDIWRWGWGASRTTPSGRFWADRLVRGGLVHTPSNGARAGVTGLTKEAAQESTWFVISADEAVGQKKRTIRWWYCTDDDEINNCMERDLAPLPQNAFGDRDEKRGICKTALDPSVFGWNQGAFFYPIVRLDPGKDRHELVYLNFDPHIPNARVETRTFLKSSYIRQPAPAKEGDQRTWAQRAKAKNEYVLYDMYNSNAFGCLLRRGVLSGQILPESRDYVIGDYTIPGRKNILRERAKEDAKSAASTTGESATSGSGQLLDAVDMSAQQQIATAGSSKAAVPPTKSQSAAAGSLPAMFQRGAAKATATVKRLSPSRKYKK